MKKIPSSFQGVLWSSPVDKLDLAEHKSYIIHQILMYGNFDHIRWLFKVYSKGEIKDVFLNEPQKVYTKPAFNFVKNFILGLDSKKLETDKYVNTIY